MRLIDIEPYEFGRRAHMLFAKEDGKIGQIWTADIPTVDAVPVVRCKDCKHCDVLDKKKQMLACPYYEGRGVQPEHFCGDGERKDGDTIG